MATGVLPLLLGRATKAAALLPDTDKAYEADFRFGERRDTGDATGRLLAQDETPVERAALEAALPRFTGDILQVPPMYSAVSVNGQRLYKLARQGVEVERAARPVHIAALSLVEYDAAQRAGRLAVTCSKGTYIRTLIEDVAASLGTCGVMTALRRTAACGFTLGTPFRWTRSKRCGRPAIFRACCARWKSCSLRCRPCTSRRRRENGT